MVSEEKSFESVDGRRTDDGGFPYYKLPRSLRLRGAKKSTRRNKCFELRPMMEQKYNEKLSYNFSAEQENHKQGNIRSFTDFEEKKLIGIPYSPVKWTAKVDRILFILVILYKSLHGVLGQKGS